MILKPGTKIRIKENPVGGFYQKYVGKDGIIESYIKNDLYNITIGDRELLFIYRKRFDVISELKPQWLSSLEKSLL